MTVDTAEFRAIQDDVAELRRRVDRLSTVDSIIARAGGPAPARAGTRRRAARQDRPRHLRVVSGGREAG